MFTGIIEEVGKIERIQNGSHSAVLHIQAQKILDDLKIGDSVAVNGVCLTATSFHKQGFTADVMHETLNRSALALLQTGSRVNLERAMPVDGRFGGHIVAGHVDGMGKIMRIEQDDNAVWYTVQAAESVMKYIVEKGSIAIDGISLTVAKVATAHFSISAIPHTVRETTLKERRIGDAVNLETDIIGKYVEKFLCPKAVSQPNSGLTREFLAKYGY